MHETILKFFGFLKSCTQFIKILLMFCILMFILYWIQNLTGDYWAWTSFLNGFFDFFLAIGQLIMPGSIKLFDAVFEFKYMIASLIFLVLYALTHFAYISVEILEDTYGEGRRRIKRIEEKRFNENLEKRSIAEQKKITRFQVYVETHPKEKSAHRDFNVNMDEQNQILIKHLMGKTGMCPEKFEKGFLFSFDSFSKIDDILDIFNKLPKSKAPINYVICVQIMGTNIRQELQQLKMLIELKTLNKITTMADTVYRYKYNSVCRYETTQVGLYQKEDINFEVYEFIGKD